MSRHIISVLVENEAGALSRISGLFSARGYNIESLTVAPTEDASMSRMTIVTTGSEDVVEQITKQLNKLIEVVKVVDLSEVIVHRRLPEAIEPAACVRREQHDDRDPCLFGSVNDREGLVESEVVELTHSRVTGGAKLAVHECVIAPDGLGRLSLCLSEHQLTPGPEVAASVASAKCTLKRVTVRIDETRQMKGVGHA